MGNTKNDRMGTVTITINAKKFAEGFARDFKREINRRLKLLRKPP